MKYSDLKEGNIEEIISDFNLSEEEVRTQLENASNYDNYYIVEDEGNIGFLSVLTQPFGDPYIRFEIDKCDILDYKGHVSNDAFLDVMDAIFLIPQIVRAKESNLEEFLRRGFDYLKNEDGTLSRLQHVRKYLSEDYVIEKDERIRAMEYDDLEEIKNLFKEEYPLRYRSVEKMYTPGLCFVLEEDGEIKGVSFNQKRIDDSGEAYLYAQQILVRKSAKGGVVIKSILKEVENLAYEIGVRKIIGNSRDKVIRFYSRSGAEPFGDMEYYLLREKIENKH